MATSRRVHLATGPWEIECLPHDGGRLSVLRFDGRDLLTSAPERFTPPAGDFGAFESRPAYGYDDCFPTVDACRFPGDETFDAPDHGELLWLEWDVRAEGDRLECRATSQLLPVTFRRTLIPSESALRWEFEIENLSDRSIPCLHVMHALMPPGEIAGLRLPECEAVHDESIEGIPVWAGGDDPASYLLNAAPRTAHMLLMRRCRSGCAEVAFRDGPVIEITWPVELLPTLGVWWNNGGFPDEDACRRYECALEPMPGSTSSLATSHADRMHLTVPPHGRLSWCITWTIKAPGPGRSAC